MKTLILTEKKDAGCELAVSLPDSDFNLPLNKIKNEGKKGYLESNKYIISWAIGHLFNDAMPEEINPKYALYNHLDSDEDYKMKDLLSGLKRIPGTEDYQLIQLKTISKLINRNDINNIILASDADAEGEAICRDVLSLRKNLKDLNIVRFWNTGSFKSKEAVKKAMANLKPYNEPKYESLYHSQLARSRADFLLGLKTTKVATNYYNKDLFFGRVKSVIIGLLGNRENEINNFVSSEYYSLSANIGDIEFSHFFYSENDEDADKPKKERHYFNIDQINKVQEELRNNDNEVAVKSFETKRYSSNSRPLPLSGSSFASEMMGRYNISYDDANEILSYLRSEGFTSYQGTNGRYFHKNDSQDVLDALKASVPYYGVNVEFNIDAKLFNNAKAERQNHSPLHNTGKQVTNSDLEKWENHKLPKIKEAYELISKRILVWFLEDDELEKQNLTICSTKYDHHFDLTGQRAIKQGWRSFVEQEIKDTTFQLETDLEKGDTFNLDSTEINVSKTKAPQLYTIKTLLDTLCNVSRVIDKLQKESVDPAQIKKYKQIKKLLNKAEGIGTDRTRATIIKDLMSHKNKAISANKKDQLSLTELGKEQFQIYPPEMKSIIFTANWENSFEEIRRGELNYLKFLHKVDETIMYSIIPHIINNVGVKVLPKINKREPIENLSCPLCNSTIYEKNTSYTCENNTYKDGEQSGCNFSIFKDLSKTLGRVLEGEDDFMLVMQATSDNPYKESKHSVYFDIESKYFVGVKWDKEASSKEIIETNKTYKAGDRYFLKEFRGRKLSKTQAEKLFNGSTIKINRVSKKGKKYTVNVSLNNNQLSVTFV